MPFYFPQNHCKCSTNYCQMLFLGYPKLGYFIKIKAFIICVDFGAKGKANSQSYCSTLYKAKSKGLKTWPKFCQCQGCLLGRFGYFVIIFRAKKKNALCTFGIKIKNLNSDQERICLTRYPGPDFLVLWAVCKSLRTSYCFVSWKINSGSFFLVSLK